MDVGAALLIRQELRELRRQGVAILVVSDDLEELLELCDRIAVMTGGRLSPARPVGETSVEAIGLLMGGAGASGAGGAPREDTVAAPA